MDASFITPFMRSIDSVFSTMLQTTVKVLPPRLKPANEKCYDVSGIIGISGDVTGATVIGFPMETAMRVIKQFTGAEIPASEPDFSDAVGELVNMITGSAKAEFTGKKASISCPSVVVGACHHVTGSRDMPTIVIPCECDLGSFAMEVTIKDNSPAASPAACASAAAR